MTAWSESGSAGPRAYPGLPGPPWGRGLWETGPVSFKFSVVFTGIEAILSA